MNLVDDILKRAQAEPRNLPVGGMAALLGSSDEGAWETVRAAAYELKAREVGRKVNLRGLVECSNVCAKDCLYCGIRRSNAEIERYAMDEAEIVECCRSAREWGYGSVALQAGEIESEANTARYERVLRAVAPDLGVTLSLGEQEADVLARWRAAGAVRYLLRIETSDRGLYGRIHPAGHDWTRRRNCLSALRDLDYQVGTGVMIGLPGQTPESLARDIVFFGEIDADMIGMGPWIPHPAAPLGDPGWTAERALRLGLRMIALTRLYLWDVNIAATTALQALGADGRERGLLHGANVIMPNVTPLRWREGYRLYAGKPGTDENAAASRRRLEASLAAIGETVNYGVQGNSRHYLRRRGGTAAP